MRTWRVVLETKFELIDEAFCVVESLLVFAGNQTLSTLALCCNFFIRCFADHNNVVALDEDLRQTPLPMVLFVSPLEMREETADESKE